MRPILVFLVVASFSTGTRAQVGPTTLNMTCAQAAGLVTSRGAVVLRTGPTTYDRYVRDPSFCALQETTRPAWVRTADIAQRYVGGVCRLREIDNER
jgi:hypothetical protein